MLRKIFSLLLFVSIIFFNGCDKESDPLTPPEEHFEPTGWLFMDTNDSVLLAIWEGKVQNNWNGISKDTLLNIIHNAPQLIRVVFVDAGRINLTPPTDAGYELGWEFVDTNLVSISGGTDKYSFTVQGKNVGQTTAQFFILHAGHKDIITPYFTVWVK